MIIMILENVPVSVRGELSRWLLEPRAGVFIGHVSGMVRDRLWDKCCENEKVGGLMQAWSNNTEQRFSMRTHGDTSRRIIDYEGIQLVQIPNKTRENVNGSVVASKPDNR